MLIEAHTLACLRISDNAACYGSCNLAHKYLSAVVGGDDDGGAFILGARLGQIGCKETPGVMLHIFHHSSHRGPVGMHVENGHEYRELNHIAMQILVFVDLLKSYHLAVD